MTPRDGTTDEVHRMLTFTVEQTVGADIDGHLGGRIAAHVAEQVRRLGLDGPKGYLGALFAGGDGPGSLLDALLAVVLVHETFFYRFAAQLEALEERVLPRLVDGRGGEPIRIWSAGCSRGPEPYTLAMLAAEAAARRGSRTRVEVLATDVCEAFLEDARRGRYGVDKVRDLPERLRDLYLRRLEDGSYEVAEALRRAVRFERHNLLDPPPASGFDLVSCRNVLMYLRRRSRRQAVEHLVQALGAGGLLLVGHSESLRRQSDLVVSRRSAGLGIYGRALDGLEEREAPGPAASPAPPAAPRRAPPPDPAPRRKAASAAPEEARAGDEGSRCRLALVGDYDAARWPERVEGLKSELGEAIDRGRDVVVEADGATCLDDATATLIARAARVIESRGGSLVVLARRPPVRRWAERNRLRLGGPEVDR